ncbi:hypothetical protein GGU11DRAFT_660453, partial [Lentinula aff. detonsa]
KQASRDYEVPYRTLLNRRKGLKPRKKAHEKEMLLTGEEQKVVVEWIQYLGLAGIPVCKCTLRLKIKAIMESKGQAITEKSVSTTWIRKFYREHKVELKTSRGSALDPKRAQAFNFATV